jgi:hypothetical protein
MYVERLPSGMFGLYRDDGFRIGVFHTREEAKKAMNGRDETGIKRKRPRRHSKR